MLPSTQSIWISKIEDWDFASPLSILGPTGSGKTRLALELAQKFISDGKNPLLVSLDSVAAYQKLDIGSAKPRRAEILGFDWVGLDVFPITEKIAAPEFCKKISVTVQVALDESRPVILVGGSHFYENAFVEGVRPGDPSDSKYLDSLGSYSNQQLLNNLIGSDLRWRGILHVNDRYRLERYSDLVFRQNLTFEDLKGASANRSFVNWPVKVSRFAVGMDFSFEENQKRLKLRIDQMWNEGWVSEVKNLLDSGWSPESPGLQTIGYFEIVQFLQGKYSEQECRNRVLFSHQQLSKKQRTWIRGHRK